METYPNKCSYCHSPARVNKQFIFCSNTKCKSWKPTRKALKNFIHKKIGLTSDNPIIVLCPRCGSDFTCIANPHRELYRAICQDCNYRIANLNVLEEAWWQHIPINNMWYLSKTYVMDYYTQYVNNKWDFDNEIQIYNNERWKNDR